jgi:acyl-CoA synthetase (NDP forming)
MQSGGLMMGLIRHLVEREIGLHCAIDVARAADTGFEALAAHLLADAHTRVLALHIESMKTLDELVDIARMGLAVDKPIVLTLAGITDAGQRAVQSHTGALATPRRIIEGIARQFGIILTTDLDEMTWALEALNHSGFRRPPGSGVGVFAMSGGSGVLLADALQQLDIPLPDPRASTKKLLVDRPESSILNPYDFPGPHTLKTATYESAVRAYARDSAFSILVRIDGAGLPEPSVPRHEAECTEFSRIVESLGKVAVIATGVDQDTRKRSDLPNVTSAAGPREAAVKLMALSTFGESTGTRKARRRTRHRNTPVDMQISVPMEATPGTVLTGEHAASILAPLPLRWPKQLIVASPLEASGVRERFPFPVVVKTESGTPHRHDVGGVLRANDAKGLAAAVAYLCAQFGGPVSISEYVEHAAEYIVGFQRSERFGRLLMFGIGGTSVGSRVEFRRMPASEDAIHILVKRYISPVPESLIRVLTTLENVVGREQRITSIDLNPIVLGESGEPYALDAKVHL